MNTRALTLAAGLTGAAGLSQFPEFSQQYMQRLGGAVDELSRQVTRYEADAAAHGLNLSAYITALAAEGPMARTQAENMASDVARHKRLSEALEQLEGAGPFMRARLASHIGDEAIIHQAMRAFKPALPATFEGAIFAGTGFLAGWLGLAVFFAVLKRLWSSGRALSPRRRRAS